MSSHISITDEAIQEILATVGTFQPETGGALMGLSASTMVSRFLFDDEATTTGASYIPSDRLQARVQTAEVESARALELKGILHSHPAGMNRPSSTDLRSFQDYLEANPHLPMLTAAIATFVKPGRERLEEHELESNGLRLSWFTIHRSSLGAASKATPRIVPVSDLKTAITRSTGFACGHLLASWSESIPVVTFDVSSSGTTKALVTLTGSYPAASPIAFVAGGDQYEVLSQRWDFNQAVALRIDRFSADLAGHFREPEIDDAAAGTHSAPAPTPTPDGARELSPPARPGGSSFRCAMELMARLMPFRPKASPDLGARSRGFLDDSIRGERVLVLGCGSVGSSMASLLARSGIRDFVLVDPDRVEGHNISRSEFRVQDVGRDKVGALGSVLKQINPNVHVSAHARDLNEMSDEDLKSLVSSATLVVGACDSPRAQGRLAHFAYSLRRPGVFVGIYARAAGGEIIASASPGACFNCAVRGRNDLQGDEGRSVDYETGRLVAEPGLYADIRVISSAAAKLLLSLSRSLPKTSPLRGDFREPILQGKSWVAFGTTPEFWFFPQLLSAAGQHAFQSVWMTVERDAECTTCGTSPAPLMNARPVATEDLRRQLGRQA